MGKIITCLRTTVVPTNYPVANGDANLFKAITVKTIIVRGSSIIEMFTFKRKVSYINTETRIAKRTHRNMTRDIINRCRGPYSRNGLYSPQTRRTLAYMCAEFLCTFATLGRELSS